MTGHSMAPSPPIAASLRLRQVLQLPAHISLPLFGPGPYNFHIQSQSSFQVIGIGTLKFNNFVELIHGNTARKDPCLEGSGFLGTAPRPFFLVSLSKAAPLSPRDVYITTRGFAPLSHSSVFGAHYKRPWN